MLIVPEIEKVFILVPRTGSGSLFRALIEKYPRSMLLYRHMEADGVPHGYDRWERIGVVRHPVTRLFSLYHFLSRFDGGGIGSNTTETERIRSCVRGKTFEEWLLTDLTIFSKNDGDGYGLNRPILTRRNSIPDDRCSQWFWLRPDLGTTIWKFEHIGGMAEAFDIDLHHKRHNLSHRPDVPMLGTEAQEHILRYFAWDLEQGCAL